MSNWLCENAKKWNPPLSHWNNNMEKTFEMFVNVNNNGHLYACGVPIWREREREREKRETLKVRDCLLYWVQKVIKLHLPFRSQKINGWWKVYPLFWIWLFSVVPDTGRRTTEYLETKWWGTCFVLVSRRKGTWQWNGITNTVHIIHTINWFILQANMVRLINYRHG